MATHEQCYITCDKCGVLLEEDGRTVTGETDDCVKGEAEDVGWSCYVGINQEDFCGKCAPSAEKKSNE